MIGWKEYELEVMRDLKDNVVIVCPIENLDPMGVHTGDSITVAPAMTLTDKEYQMHAGCRGADHPRDRRRYRRVEHSVRHGSRQRRHGRHRNESARVAEFGARVESDGISHREDCRQAWPSGYTLDEITNDITGVTKASFEPTIDYVVVKIPRFAFQKFQGADPTLTTQMKSVGEVMAIGRTFKESLPEGDPFAGS